MLSHIEHLHAIAKASSKRILGLMSGTSLDGLDIALCKIEQSGRKTHLRLEQFVSLPFDDEYKRIVGELFAQSDAKLQDVCIANAWIARVHAGLVNQALSEWGIAAQDVDLIASHGQTIFHAPKHQHKRPNMPDATLQIGDGDHIAQLTGITTLSDFRQKHVAAGGQGAPMVKYGDYLLFVDAYEHRVLLNLGGIANISSIPENAGFDEIISTDTGPANTYMDAMVQRHLWPQRYDKNGELAAQGTVFQPLLDALLTHEFFALPSPKTTGQEAFNLKWLDACIEQTHAKELSIEDLLATLCEFSALGISLTLSPLLEQDSEFHVYASGGGANNPFLLSRIAANLPMAKMHSIEELGLNADAKEAALFALLANECISGHAKTFANSAGSPAVSMGKISFAN